MSVESSRRADGGGGPTINVERTLAMIKPDAMPKSEEIEDIILQAGFTILQKRWIHLSPEQCSEFYSDHSSKMFFPSLVAFMSSGPVIAMELAKVHAIRAWRDLIGPTNSKKAREQQMNHTVRAKYGTDEQCNAVHGSDSEASAEREIRFFFATSILEPIPSSQHAKDYLENKLNPTLLKALTQLCKEKPAEPVTWLADYLLLNNPYKPLVNTKYKISAPSQAQSANTQSQPQPSASSSTA
jgi:nucleoside diphosphate kinase